MPRSRAKGGVSGRHASRRRTHARRASGRQASIPRRSGRPAPGRAAPGRSGTVAALGEFALIDRLTALVPATGPGVVLGIGDDTAVLRLTGLVLATCDVQVEGVHFTGDLCSPADIGWRALAVNLSDIAAMGGVPRHALVSLVLPPRTPVEMMEGVYRGLAEAARAHGVVVVGGNVARTSGPLVIDVTLLGEAAAPLRRDGARPGDGVWITGSVGKAAGGLFLLRHPNVFRAPAAARKAASPGAAAYDRAVREALTAAYRRPVPRVAVGQALAATGLVTAMVDTSDGTAADLLHLVEASGTGVRLEAGRLPLAEGLGAVAHAARVNPAAWALGGGEDYELLFTASSAFEAGAPALSRQTGVAITRIGEIVPETSGRWLIEPGSRRAVLTAAGWNHFSVRETQR